MAAQIGNRADGDIAGGDINKVVVTPPKPTVMTRLIMKWRDEQARDARISHVIEHLQHFFDRATKEQVSGIEEKLAAGQRTGQIHRALMQKERAAKLIAKLQGSEAAQEMLAQIMAKLEVSFTYAVSPLINRGASQADVDRTLLTEVIEPTFAFLEDNPLNLSQQDVDGLIYFLTGNCHLRWEPC